MLTRRKFLCGAALSAAGAALYSRYLEPGWLEVTYHKVPFFPGTGSRLRILHLSDLHYSKDVPISLIVEAFRLGLEQRPDLICLTGDYRTSRIPDRAQYVESLKKLSSFAPTFACLGNHDYSKGFCSVGLIVRDVLKEAGITLLENRSTLVDLQGRRIALVGMGDLWAKLCLPEEAFAGHSPGVPALVLSHNPDSKALLQAYSWNLMLCGHTHGGQVKIPLLGAPHAPIRDFAYLEGLNAFEGRWIYTTRGVGNLCGIRFNCRPEVTVLDLGSVSG